MAAVKVLIDDTLLDDGSTRQIVGHPYIVSDPAGKIHEFYCEFLVHAATAAAFDTIFDSTFDGLELLNPRLRYWQDSSVVPPTLDWYIGDGKHLDIVSSVQVLADESRTQRKIHCLLRVVAMKQLDLSTGVPPITETTLTGQASKIEITKLYMDSERYTLSAAGSFKSTQNPAVEGPFDLLSVSNASGKARFTLQSGTITDAFDADAGQFIDVSSPSAYQGRHFITAIATGNVITTNTTFASVEGDVNATLLFGDTTSADANFAAAKDVILRNLLETGDDGSPNAASPHMGKTAESIAYSSERKDILDFLLVSSPAPMVTSTNDSAGNPVERGLMFAVKYIPPEFWNETHAPMLWGVVIEGKCAVTETARGTNDIAGWCDQIKLQVLNEAVPTINSYIGGSFRERRVEFTVDEGTGDCQFLILGDGNYTGTLMYARSTTFNTKQPRTAWRNTDKTHSIQEPPGPEDKMALIRVTWMGEAGAAPGVPVAPVESGFVYMFDESTIVSEDNMVDPNGNSFESKTIDYTFQRFKIE